MRTQSLVSIVMIQVSDKPVLTLPKPLIKQLGVRRGQKVSVRVRNGTLHIRRDGHRKPRPKRAEGLHARSRPRSEQRARRTAKITDLIGAIPAKPGAPKVNIEELFSHHGYEQLERPGRKGY